MMLFAPNFLVRQKEGAQGEEEVVERQAQQEILRQARTLPQVHLGQGCRMRGPGENMDGCVRFHSTGGLVLSSRYRNGGSYKRMNGVGKEQSCRGERALLLPLKFLGSSLKDMVTRQKIYGIENSFRYPFAYIEG